MKKISRIKRVALDTVLEDTFIGDWQDCYILFQTRSYTDVQKLQKEFAKITKENRVLEKTERRLNRQIESETNLEKLEVLEAELEAVKDSQDDIANKMIALSDKVLLDSFKGGMIKDDNNKLVELTKEDLTEFDTEVKSALIAHVSGTVSKKK